MYCKKCGFLIPKDSQFCTNCGATVEPKTHYEASLDVPAEKKKIANEIPSVGLNIISYIVFLIGVFIWIMLLIVDQSSQRSNSVLKSVGISLLADVLITLSIIITVIAGIAVSDNWIIWVLLAIILPIVFFGLGLLWVVKMTQSDIKKVTE
jgi:RNA polymerase subunit RPABC4/transcription elongation factor Spt4